MTTMNSGASITASNKLSQVVAMSAMTQYSKWDRERDREKEKDRKRKRRAEFAMHLKEEMNREPGEAGYYFEARA
ncbi:MAG: hypothetical protein K6E19_01115 [Lachnospiraceae bacterium]|nr:hypothetical protein [Lachnospiraceae bacterium]